MHLLDRSLPAERVPATDKNGSKRRSITATTGETELRDKMRKA
jgi:hypothetical protein